MRKTELSIELRNRGTTIVGFIRVNSFTPRDYIHLRAAAAGQKKPEKLKPKLQQRLKVDGLWRYLKHREEINNGHGKEDSKGTKARTHARHK